LRTSETWDQHRFVKVFILYDASQRRSLSTKCRDHQQNTRPSPECYSFENALRPLPKHNACHPPSLCFQMKMMGLMRVVFTRTSTNETEKSLVDQKPISGNKPRRPPKSSTTHRIWSTSAYGTTGCSAVRCDRPCGTAIRRAERSGKARSQRACGTCLRTSNGLGVIVESEAHISLHGLATWNDGSNGCQASKPRRLLPT